MNDLYFLTIFAKEGGTGLIASGLVIKSTSKEPGEYRRLGVFDIRDEDFGAYLACLDYKYDQEKYSGDCPTITLVWGIDRGEDVPIQILFHREI